MAKDRLYTGLIIRASTGPILGRSVWAGRRELLPQRSQKLRNHSPDGFNWGYQGSGPAQLALALLLDAVGKELALAWYQHFKRQVVARWEANEGWTITRSEICMWIDGQLEAQGGYAHRAAGSEDPGQGV